MFIPKHLQERLELAKKKFGRPFAHEPGTDWKPNPIPLLTRYFDELRQRSHRA